MKRREVLAIAVVGIAKSDISMGDNAASNKPHGIVFKRMSVEHNALTKGEEVTFDKDILLYYSTLYEIANAIEVLVVSPEVKVKWGVAYLTFDVVTADGLVVERDVHLSVQRGSVAGTIIPLGKRILAPQASEDSRTEEAILFSTDRKMVRSFLFASNMKTILK